MSKLAARLLEECGGLEALNKNSNLAKSFRSQGVYHSAEFVRVRDLPRRILLGIEDSDEADRLARAVSNYLWWAAGGTGDSPVPLRPMQAAMLVDCAEHDGMMMSLPVGCGKSWAAALFTCEPGSIAPELLAQLDGLWPQVEAERPLLILPPSVRDEMERDVIPNLQRAYRIHSNLKLLSYSELQLEKNATILTGMSDEQIDQAVEALGKKHKINATSAREMFLANTAVEIVRGLRPDFIGCDEVHNLKNLTSARTKRVKVYMSAYPQTIFAGMTATLADRSLRDFHHLVLWSHPLDPPLPRGWKELQDWANAVDADVPVMERLPPGALLELCAPGENAREGLARRMAETPGFILASEASCDVPLTLIARRDVPLPESVRNAIDTLNDAWVLPNGEPVADAARWAAHARSLALGFYYVWDWSKITRDGKPDMEWLEAKRDWSKAVAEVCRRGLPDFDSEKRVRNGARRGDLPRSLQGESLRALEKWDEQRIKPKPPTVPMWLTDVVMRWALKWMDDHPAGIVWVEHDAAQEWFNERVRHVYMSGMNEELRRFAKSDIAGTVPIVCSRGSHFQGKNLQAWHDNLVLTPGPNAKIWEQMLGREHRAGQKAREVRAEFLAHTDISYRSMAVAMKRAHFIREEMRAPQKLLDCAAVGWNKSQEFESDALDRGFDN